MTRAISLASSRRASGDQSRRCSTTREGGSPGASPLSPMSSTVRSSSHCTSHRMVHGSRVRFGFLPATPGGCCTRDQNKGHRHRQTSHKLDPVDDDLRT